MDNQHLNEEQIAVCAEAMNKGEYHSLPVELREHLKECTECSNLLLLVSETIEEEVVGAKVNSRVEKRKLFLPFSVAASIVVLVAAGFYIKSHQQATVLPEVAEVSDTVLPQKTVEPVKIVEAKPKKEESAVVTTENKPVIKETAPNTKEMLAYVPNEDLDKLAQRFSSGALRGDVVEVETATEMKTEKQAIVLQWKNPDKETLIIELYNNKGELVKEYESNSSLLEIKDITTNGLYYWKLINEDFDLLFCGKILVE
jgi:hypothetical protein